MGKVDLVYVSQHAPCVMAAPILYMWFLGNVMIRLIVLLISVKQLF
jgi:hypothetical protein